MAGRFSYAVCVAIQEILKRCRQADEPLACLCAALEELRDRKWCESDVERVELAVRKVLCDIIPREYESVAER